MSWKDIDPSEVPNTKSEVYGYAQKRRNGTGVGPFSVFIATEILTQINEAGAAAIVPTFVRVEVGEAENAGKIRISRCHGNCIKHAVSFDPTKKRNNRMAKITLPLKYKDSVIKTPIAYVKQGEVLILTLPCPELIESA